MSAPKAVLLVHLPDELDKPYEAIVPRSEAAFWTDQILTFWPEAVVTRLP